jgi:hypothetical protein
MAFTNMKFKNMRGGLTVSETNKMYSGSTSIRVFDNTLQGDIYFDSSTVAIVTENSFGIPLDLKINNMRVITTDNKSVRLTTDTPTLKLTDGNGTATVAAPTILGDTAVNNNIINSNNSNLSAVLNPAPNQLDYEFTPVFATGNNQFITDKSRFLVRVKVEIPIFGVLKKYTLGDTLQIDKFPKRSDKNWTVDSIQFTFKTQNSLPFDTYTQLYFIDSTNNIIDSLHTNPSEFIRRPVIDAQGRSIQAVDQTTIVQMGGIRYDKIMSKTMNIYLFTRILTSKDGNDVQRPIQVFSYNKLRLTIGVLATGQVRPTE